MSDSPKPLRIWLVCVGEYLPTDPGHERKLRMSMLADTLHAQGHDVTWWASTFDHEAKRQRFQQHTSQAVAPGYQLELLHGRPYRRNVSLARLGNHADLAREFRRVAPRLPQPDLVVATLPTVELAAAAGEYARARGIPFAVDVRDQHPDIYLELVPHPARPLARLVLRPLYRQLHQALDAADALTAISPSILRWGLSHAGRPIAPAEVIPIGYPELGHASVDLGAAEAHCRSLGVDPDKRIVWYVGTFNRWIDLGSPIEAARQLAGENCQDVQFVFSGSGDLDRRWREQATGLPNVIFSGWVDVPKIAYLRSVAWVGLAPYQKGFNAFGNKLFEFLAAGLPILFSIEGDAREVLEGHGAGINYPAGNAAALAGVIRRLLANPEERDRLAAAALSAYRLHYRSEAVYARFSELLTGIIGRRGIPHP